MKKWSVLFLTAVLLILSLSAFAGESKYYSGDSYILKQGETVDGDLFVASNSISIEGTVTGEVFLAGSSVKVSGEIAGDAFIIGDNVDLSGRFLTDARVLGNTVELTGIFDGEVSTAGRYVDIDATVTGVVNAAGETVSAAGAFANTVNIHARKAMLLADARFEKDVNVQAEEFTKADSVAIAGKLNQVIGKAHAQEKEKKKEEAGGCWFVLIFWLVCLLGIIIVGLIVNTLFPNFMTRTTKLVTAEPIANIGWGLLTLILFPIVFCILLVTLIGIPLALLLLVFILIGLYLGKLFVAVAAGSLIATGLFKKEGAFWVRLVVGAVILYLVLAIPIVGWLVAVIVFCMGIGAIVNGFLSSRKRPAAVQNAKAAAARTRPLPKAKK